MCAKDFCKFLILIITTFFVFTENVFAQTHTEYLAKPTGAYAVGFEDFHWINQKVCPDFNYNGKNQADFSADNPNFCHEIVSRIYYPVAIKEQPRAKYYQPIIKDQQDLLRTIPGIPKEQIEQLSLLKSFTIEKAPVMTEKQFPVLLFSPGFGCPAELYENFITELVSQGYIVVSVNTTFINPVELPNGHLVKSAHPKNREEVESKFVPLQANDLIFVLEQIHLMHHANPLFLAMDLKHIGSFGHSIGARILADVAHAHSDSFQAAVTLDIGFDTTGASTKKFPIPFMHQISANRRSAPMVFELGNNGYLVGLSPSEEDHDYSYHMDFSDLATLQYLPAMQAFQAYEREHILDGFNLKVMSRDPTAEESKHFVSGTHVLVKAEGKWHYMYYAMNHIRNDLEINQFKGLGEAIANLPNKIPEQLTEAEIEPVRTIIMNAFRHSVEMHGAGNGWENTQSINQYLLKFFNHFLKQEENPAFKKCIILSKNTYMKCGPGEV